MVETLGRKEFGDFWESKVARAGDFWLSILSLQEFQDCHPTRLVSSNSPKSLEHWKPPSDGLVKINIDATISEAGTGIGVVIRDSSDTVKVAMAQPLPFVPPF